MPHKIIQELEAWTNAMRPTAIAILEKKISTTNLDETDQEKLKLFQFLCCKLLDRNEALENA